MDLDRHVRQSVKAIQQGMIETRVMTRFLGRDGYYRTHTAGHHAPDVRVEHLVAVVFDSVAHIPGHTLINPRFCSPATGHHVHAPLCFVLKIRGLPIESEIRRHGRSRSEFTRSGRVYDQIFVDARRGARKSA